MQCPCPSGQTTAIDGLRHPDKRITFTLRVELVRFLLPVPPGSQLGAVMSNAYLKSLQIEECPISLLKPHAHNARTHSKKQLHQIAASIDAFGFTNPVLIDQSNTIIAGHGRVAAANCSVSTRCRQSGSSI